MKPFPKKYDVVVAGYVSVDIVPDFKKNGVQSTVTDFFIPGKLIEINGIGFSPGGVVANTGIAMQQFGKRILLNGLIGSDLIGKILLELLTDYNSTDGITVTDSANTAFGIVISPPGVDRIFLESPGCNQLIGLSHINVDGIAQSRLFHFGYPPLLRQFYLNDGYQLVHLFRTVKAQQVATSLDFSLPDLASESGQVNWQLVLKRTLPFTDIFVPSLEEILQIMRPSLYTEIKSSSENITLIDEVSIEIVRGMGEEIINMGVKILLIKMGHRGAYLLTGDVSPMKISTDLSLSTEDWSNVELWCDAFPVDESRVKNASGSGDTAAAAFLTAILNAELPEPALRYAALAGRNNLYRANSHDSLPDWRQMTDDLGGKKVLNQGLVEIYNQ